MGEKIQLAEQFKPFVNYLLRFDDDEINRQRFLKTLDTVLLHLEADARTQIANVMASAVVEYGEKMRGDSTTLDEDLDQGVAAFNIAGEFDDVMKEKAQILNNAKIVIEEMRQSADEVDEGLSQFAVSVLGWKTQDTKTLMEMNSADEIFPAAFYRLHKEPRDALKKLLLQKQKRLEELPKILSFAQED